MYGGFPTCIGGVISHIIHAISPIEARVDGSLCAVSILGALRVSKDLNVTLGGNRRWCWCWCGGYTAPSYSPTEDMLPPRCVNFVEFSSDVLTYVGRALPMVAP